MDKPLKILAIENDEFMRIFLKDVFWIHNKGQDQFHIFGCLKKAKEFLEKPENKPDLIFLALKVPEDDGGKPDIEGSFHFLKDLKSNSQFQNVKIIIFSSFGDKEIQEKAFKLGTDKFLVKGEYLPDEIIKIAQETASNSIPFSK